MNPAIAVPYKERANLKSVVWLPSLADLFVLAMAVWMFGSVNGWSGLLGDADTGWHIRTGEYILQHHRVPTTDLFSFSKPGAEWFAWEWLSDVIFAVLHSGFGLAGIVALAGIMICTVPLLLLRHLVGRGVTGFFAIALTLLYTGAASVHYLARPHLFTLILFTLCMFVLQRDRECPTRALWLLVPLTTVWTNLHGGFLAGIAAIGLLAIGVGVEELWRGGRSWVAVRRYGALLAWCGAASLLNPYGWALHRHIAQYLRSSFINDMVQEFRAPQFRSEGELQYKILLLAAVVCVGALLRQRRVAESLWILYFAHMSLQSARHIPLFAIIAVPIIGRQLSSIWVCSPRSMGGILRQVSDDLAAGLRRHTWWLPAGLACLLLFTPGEWWPKDFPETFPVKATQKFRERLAHARVLTSDQWGDYLIYHSYPQQRVFLDGRSDFYGEELGKKYVATMDARYDWKELFERYRFDLALLPVGGPLASVLKMDRSWRVLHDDGTAILLERRPART